MRPVFRFLKLASATVVALLFVAGSALAHDHDDHGHDHDDDSDVDYADPVIWDGGVTVDCAVAGEGTIVWELTGSDRVTYAELHIDEPVRSVTSRNAPPYVWWSPAYPLDEIEADADRITGQLADGAQLLATTCPVGGEGAGSVVPVVAAGLGGLLVGGVGMAFVRRRPSGTDSADTSTA